MGFFFKTASEKEEALLRKIEKRCSHLSNFMRDFGDTLQKISAFTAKWNLSYRIINELEELNFIVQRHPDDIDKILSKAQQVKQRLGKMLKEINRIIPKIIREEKLSRRAKKELVYIKRGEKILLGIEQRDLKTTIARQISKLSSCEEKFNKLIPEIKTILHIFDIELRDDLEREIASIDTMIKKRIIKRESAMGKLESDLAALNRKLLTEEREIQTDVYFINNTLLSVEEIIKKARQQLKRRIMY